VIVTAILLLIIVFSTYWRVVTFPPRNYHPTGYFLKGYAQWIEKTMDLNTIEDYLPRIDDYIWGKDFYDEQWEEYPGSLPECFLPSERPNELCFATTEDGSGKELYYRWGGGGGFGSLGFVIEFPNDSKMNINELHGHYSHYDEHQLRQYIRPNVYVYYSAN
jgi:hypothetical protein